MPPPSPAFAASVPLLPRAHPTCLSRTRPSSGLSRSPPRASLPPPSPEHVDHARAAADALHRTALHLATKGDIGPFTGVEVESTGLFLALAGGSLIAAVIVFVLIRF